MTPDQLIAETLTPEFRRMWNAALDVQAPFPLTRADQQRLLSKHAYWVMVALRTLWLLENMRHVPEAELKAWVEAEHKAAFPWRYAAPANGAATAKTRAENTAALLALLDTVL